MLMIMLIAVYEELITRKMLMTIIHDDDEAENHKDDDEDCKYKEDGEVDERIDFGRMTRSRRKDLGLSLDVLTTDTGCRYDLTTRLT